MQSCSRHVRGEELDLVEGGVQPGRLGGEGLRGTGVRGESAGRGTVGGSHRYGVVWFLHQLVHEVQVPLVEPGDTVAGGEYWYTSTKGTAWREAYSQTCDGSE